jgi:hypothetical protein
MRDGRIDASLRVDDMVSRSRLRVVVLGRGEYDPNRRPRVLCKCRCCAVSTGRLHFANRLKRAGIGENSSQAIHRIVRWTILLLRFCQWAGRTEITFGTTHAAGQNGALAYRSTDRTRHGDRHLDRSQRTRMRLGCNACFAADASSRIWQQ